MVKYINNERFKNGMYSQREASARTGLKLIFLFTLVLFSLNFSLATENLGVFKQFEPARLLQTCAVCNYVTLDSIKLPNSTVLFINQNMTQSGSTFYYDFNDTQLVGDYIYNTWFGNYTAPVSFQVNSNGASFSTQKSITQTLLIPSLGAILALILISISFIFTSEIAAKSLRYSGIIVASLTLYLCFLLEANDLLSILNAGMIAVGVGSLLESE